MELKISSVITTIEEKTINLNVGDCFTNKAGTYYYKIISEEKYIQVFTNGIFCFTKPTLGINDYGEAITSEEFDKRYIETMELIDSDLKVF